MVWRLIINLKIIKLIFCIKNLITKVKNNGGETEIRTQERVAPLPVFKTGAFNHSAISPFASFYKYNFKIQLKHFVLVKKVLYGYDF